MASKNRWDIKQQDVRSTFFNKDLNVEVYMCQPLGLEVKGEEDKVCLLKKTIYGLKQAPRAWYSKINLFFHTHGLVRSEADHNLYFSISREGLYVILILYVDDILLTGDNTQKIRGLEEKMEKFFETSRLGLACLYLRIEFIYFPEGILNCRRNIMLTQSWRGLA
jgi:hypothetical protein